MNRNEHDTIIDNRDTEMKINETTEKYVTEFEIYRKKKLVIQKMTGTTKVYLTWEQKKYKSKKKVITKKQIEKRNRKKQKTRIYKQGI